MPFWSLVVDVVRAAVFASAHLMGGSVGAGILAVSIVMRLALLPITLRTARQLREQQEKLKRIQPELAKLQQRFARDKARLQAATVALYQANDVSLVPRGLLGSFVQLPFGAAIYQAIRGGAANGSGFLWIRDLARPDVGLAMVAAGITAFAARFGGADNPRIAMAVSATITFVIAWRLSAGIALYSIAWSGVSAGEAWLVRRGAR